MNIRNGLSVLMGMMLLLASSVTQAAGPSAVLKQVEASMLVTGTIRVDAQGKVLGFELDDRDKLSADIVGILNKTVPAWRFKPALLDGKPVEATTDMSVRLVAKQIEGDNFSIALRSAAFGQQTPKPEQRLRAGTMTPPQYPSVAGFSRGSGTVYLLVRVGKDGKVTDAMAEQVNLDFVAGDREMSRWRNVLATASVRQAARWTFIPPTEGAEAREDFWVARVPVVFMRGERTLSPYTWRAYVPGPRQRDPWMKEDEGAAFSPDALPPGNAYLAGSGLQLLTALSGR